MRDLLSIESARTVLVELFESVLDAAQAAYRAGDVGHAASLATALGRALRDDPSLGRSCAGVDHRLIRMVDEVVERMGGPAADRAHRWVVLESVSAPGRFFTPLGDEYLIEGLVTDAQIYRMDHVPLAIFRSSHLVPVGSSNERPNLKEALAVLNDAPGEEAQEGGYERPRCAA